MLVIFVSVCAGGMMVRKQTINKMITDYNTQLDFDRQNNMT